MSVRSVAAPPTPPASPTRARHTLAWLIRWREALGAGALFLIAGALRLGLAMRGWPYINSDEAVMGLMSVDIAHGVSRPIFSYDQNYIGALQAYLAAPLFALLHNDPLALRLATLLETLLFLGVIYALARLLYSPGVALLTLALLSFGPEYLLKHELQAGVGAQDTLLFGALTVWLTTLLLRGGWSRWARLGLDAALGLSIGLGLWGDLLFLPYVFAAALALGYCAARNLARAHTERRRAAGRLASDGLALLVMALLGAAPLVVANIASGGATFRHVSAIAGTPGSSSASGSLGAHAVHLIQQAGATLLVGLPAALGSESVCRACAIWPADGSPATGAPVVRAILIGAVFTLIIGGLWLAAALPLARGAQRAMSGAVAGAPASRWAARLLTLPAPDARSWGRFILLTGGALTVLQYMVSQASYDQPTFTNRYLVGIYVATPLVAAPLEKALRATWRALRASAAPGWRALAGSALLALMLGFGVFGAAHSVSVAANTTSFGDPLNSRDARLVSFLEAHHATAFYTGYWTCGRLILGSQERLNCSVISMDDAFTPGFNRDRTAVRVVNATPHPAWVFDMRALDVASSVPQQIAACVHMGAPPCAGYTSSTVNGYLIYYYAG